MDDVMWGGSRSALKHKMEPVDVWYAQPQAKAAAATPFLPGTLVEVEGDKARVRPADGAQVDTAQRLLTQCHSDLSLLARCSRGDVIASAKADAMMASFARYEVPYEWRVGHGSSRLITLTKLLMIQLLGLTK